MDMPNRQSIIISMTFVTKLTTNGQMTLPKDIRDRLKATPGNQLKVEWRQGRAVLSVQDPAKRLAAARQDSIAHLKKHGQYGLSDEQLKIAIAKQKAADYGQKYRVS